MKPHTHSPLVRSFFFWTGIIATIAYRIVIILTHADPVWLKTSWYIGTVGFIIYFWHRYQISELRTNLIQQNQLEAKIAQIQTLSADDKESMEYIFKTLQSSKEKWNYIFIFVSSGLALLVGIYLDFLSAL